MIPIIYIFIYCSIYLLHNITAFERKLGIEKFNCTNSTDTHLDKLAVIEAVGEHDKLFYIWDFGSKPTFLIFQVSNKTQIKLDCDSFLKYRSNSISFTSQPLFMFGVMLDKLYEFNDANDTANLNPNITQVRKYNTGNFNWNVSLSKIEDPVPLYALKAVHKVANSSLIQINAGAYTGDGSSIEPPHTLHTANGSQIDVILDNFQTFYNMSRFAVELVVISSMNYKNYTYVENQTIDDENTPGIFKMITTTFVNTKNNDSSNCGYLLWRPVVYTTKDKTVVASTGTNQYKIVDVLDKQSLFNFTLLNAIYGDKVTSLFMKAQNVSFGSKGDKFYQKNRFSSWSLVFGIGDAPNPLNNTLLILVSLAALTLAVMIIIAICSLPKFRANNHNFQRI